MADGQDFPAYIDKKVMRVEVHRGGNMGKVLHSKFQIVDIRPVGQTITAQENNPLSPLRFSVPSGWIRKDYAQYSELTLPNDPSFVMGLFHGSGGSPEASPLLTKTLAALVENKHVSILSQGDISLFKTSSGYQVAGKQFTAQVPGIQQPYWLAMAVPGPDIFSVVLCAASTHDALTAHVHDIETIIDSLRLNSDQ